MFKHKIMSVFLAVCFIGVFGGCEQTPEQIQADEDSEVFLDDISGQGNYLEGWDGTWNAAITYANKNDMDGVFNQMEGSNWEEKLQTELVSFRFMDGFMTVYSEPQSGDLPLGSVLYELSYEYLGTEKDVNESIWHIFQTSSDVPYKYMILQSVEDKNFPYFYMRYGDESIESLLQPQAWSPLMVSSGVTSETLKSNA